MPQVASPWWGKFLFVLCCMPCSPYYQHVRGCVRQVEMVVFHSMAPAGSLLAEAAAAVGACIFLTDRAPL